MNENQLTADEAKTAAEYFNMVLPDEYMRSHDFMWAKYESASLERSRLHAQLAEMLDVDRELIAELIEKASQKNWRPNYCGGTNIDKAYCEFIDGLAELKALPDSERHKTITFSEKEEKEIFSIKGIPCLS